jgi:hypothetical protein
MQEKYHITQPMEFIMNIFMIAIWLCLECKNNRHFQRVAFLY